MKSINLSNQKEEALQALQAEKKAQLKEKARLEAKQKQEAKQEAKIKERERRKQQEKAREDFLAVVEQLKATGKDPVFNIATDFVTVGHIGHGTYAAIKKVSHRQTGYVVALKSYDKKLLSRKSQLMAVHREIYILAGMDHPNIMKLFEVIDTKTHVHLVMELCEGKNLLDYVLKSGEKLKLKNDKMASFLNEKASKAIFKQICSAVEYIHSLDLVHRDLRIENILYNHHTGEIKFTDFGFATSFQPNESLQQLTGTAPIKDQEEIDLRTAQGKKEDTFALGIILFIMLTGGAPVWAQIDSDIYDMISCDKNQLPDFRTVTGDLRQLVDQLMSQEISQCGQLLEHAWFTKKRKKEKEKPVWSENSSKETKE